MAKVLLADDEEALRLMMGRQLQRAGHEVTLAEDGQVAADLLAQHEFDLVVSDMKMPRLDGMGLLAKAKELAPDTEFIILTGHGNMENAVLAFKTGNVFDYLLKPLDDIHELDAVVGRAVERRFLRRENIRLVGELEVRISELEETKSKLARLAESDGLTGLYNHRTIHSKLESALKEGGDMQLSTVMLDLNGFKQLNDTYGHPVGDQVLKHVAMSLKMSCGDNAVIGRCGGDEFLVVLPDTSLEQANSICSKIKEYLASNPFRNPEGTFIPLRLCFGVADAASVNWMPINLIAAADAALYEGKQNGGDTVSLHIIRDTDDDLSTGKMTFDVLDGLVTAIDRKDHYTKAHSEDVTGYALQLAQAMGCSDETYNVVRVAGLLHDVGKIGIPTSILSKPGKLTPEEYEVMKSHVTLSALIIHGLPRLADILDAVSAHHERWDGTGYPKGLAGEDIPLLGRVMAIADAFSAMTLDRPYRAGLSREVALDEIEKGRGTQFDPTLANTFILTLQELADQKLPKAA